MVDILNCARVHGNNLFHIRGTSTRVARRAVRRGRVVPDGLLVDAADVKLFIDIMFVERVPFLLSVSEPMRMPMANYLSNKSAARVKKALMRQKAKYIRQGYNLL